MVIRPELLYNIKSIPTIIFSNIYIPIGLINRVRYIFISIVLNDNDIFNF